MKHTIKQVLLFIFLQFTAPTGFMFADLPQDCASVITHSSTKNFLNQLYDYQMLGSTDVRPGIVAGITAWKNSNDVQVKKEAVLQMQRGLLNALAATPIAVKPTWVTEEAISNIQITGYLAGYSVKELKTMGKIAALAFGGALALYLLKNFLDSKVDQIKNDLESKVDQKVEAVRGAVRDVGAQGLAKVDQQIKQAHTLVNHHTKKVWKHCRQVGKFANRFQSKVNVLLTRRLPRVAKKTAEQALQPVIAESEKYREMVQAVHDHPVVWTMVHPVQATSYVSSAVVSGAQGLYQTVTNVPTRAVAAAQELYQRIQSRPPTELEEFFAQQDAVDSEDDLVDCSEDDGETIAQERDISRNPGLLKMLADQADHV